MKKPAVAIPRASSSPHWSIDMPTPATRKRKAATVQNERTVKTSLVMGASLHLQLSAAASMAGKDRNALAIDILKEALRGIVVHDRRRNPGQSGGSDRQGEASDVENSEN
jgi:hypothetical protein